MHKRALLALLLAMTMLLSSCALIEKNEEVDRATVIISAGDYAYTKGEIVDMIESQMAYNQQIYGMYGMPYDVTDPVNIQEARDAVVGYYTELVAQNIQAKKLGLDQFTEEEAASVKEIADSYWNDLRQQVKDAYFAETVLEGEALEAAIDEEIAKMNVTYAEYEQLATEEKMHEKLRALAVTEVTVTEEELQAALDQESFNAQENYLNDPTAYGLSMTYGDVIYYRPAGYPLAKQILVKFEEEDQAIIDDLSAKLATAQATVESLTEQVATMGADPFALIDLVEVTLEDNPVVATGTDLPVSEEAVVANVTNTFDAELDAEVAEVVEQLAIAQAEVDFYADQLDNAEANGLAHIDEKTDAILAEVNAEGADWDALMAQYTEDPGMQPGATNAETGYSVCAEMAGTVMDEAFVNAAMALEKMGDVTDKVPGMYGYYIIQYAGDVQEGTVALDEVRDELTNYVKTTKEDEVWQAALTKWIEEAKVKVDQKALDR